MIMHQKNEKAGLGCESGQFTHGEIAEYVNLQMLFFPIP